MYNTFKNKQNLPKTEADQLLNGEIHIVYFLGIAVITFVST